MYSVFYLLLYHILFVTCYARPSAAKAKAVSHMSKCEESLHKTCVIDQLKSEALTKNCNESKLLTCLRDHMTKDECLVHDPDTLPTIRALIEKVIRRFQKNKRCANQRFLNSMKRHFLVLGEGTSYTDVGITEVSGSGEIQDDTDTTDDDTDDGTKTNGNKGKTPEEVAFWKAKAKKITKGRQSIPLVVFFDDPTQYNKKKADEEKKPVSQPVMSAWENLQRDYSKWYRSSRYFSGS